MWGKQTRVFFLFYFDAVKRPRWLQETVLSPAKPLLFQPLLKEYGLAPEAEQLGYDQYCDAPPIELNPMMPMFQQLTASKWQSYLKRAGTPQAACAN